MLLGLTNSSSATPPHPEPTPPQETTGGRSLERVVRGGGDEITEDALELLLLCALGYANSEVEGQQARQTELVERCRTWLLNRYPNGLAHTNWPESAE